MKFYVIEGDNGTGKDTLAAKFQNDGFEILTYDKKIKQMEQIAKKKVGEDKVLNFLAYNKVCGDLAKKRKNENDVLLIRYFISSLAAAYADDIFSYQKIVDILDNIYEKFEKPNILIRLKCNQDERIRRIEQRNSSDFDDKTLTRAIKYNWISDQIISKIGLNHIDINTSNKTVDEIYGEVNKYISQAFDFTNNEIERKFKLKNLPIEINNCEKKEIEQGYLCIKPTVRIRKNGSNYSLNYKWKDKNCIESKAIQNIEYEMYLTEENYNILRKKVENNMIVKTRYKVPLKDGLIAEVDIFHGNLEGLMFCEVEFPSIETSENFIQPNWMGEDISFDKRYDNTLLSKIEKYSEDFFE